MICNNQLFDKHKEELMKTHVRKDVIRMGIAADILLTADRPLSLKELVRKTEDRFVRETGKERNEGWTTRMVEKWCLPFATGLHAVKETEKGFEIAHRFSTGKIKDAAPIRTQADVDKASKELSAGHKALKDAVHGHAPEHRPTCTFSGCKDLAKSKGHRKDGSAVWGKYCNRHNDAKARASAGPVVTPVVTIP